MQTKFMRQIEIVQHTKRAKWESELPIIISYNRDEL